MAGALGQHIEHIKEIVATQQSYARISGVTELVSPASLVEDALREVLHATTALVVAHRPSTVTLADRVALLEAGRITAVGTHSDLLRESDHYRHVISSLEDEQARMREREVNL